MSYGSSSPPPKRVKLESPPLVKSESEPEHLELEEDSVGEEDRCSICLQEVVDRTVVPLCAHEFCFDCLITWTSQSRRCPLCSQGIGDFLIHKVRSRYDYQKHYLNPLRTSPLPLQPMAPRQIRNTRRRPRDREWGRREKAERDEADKLDRSIAKRRWVYEHDLYAKHVASNSYTRYRPYPSPAQFAASPDLISRTTTFLRRELQVWVNLDVEFLTTFVISIMKAIDIRSESAVKLLSEFLDLDAPYVEGGRHVNAEHFAHEVYSYVRSPYKDLFVYDSVAQYEVPADIPPLAEQPRRRWRESSRSVSPPAPRAERNRQIRSRSRSRSPPTSSRDMQLDEHMSRGSRSQRTRHSSLHAESRSIDNLVVSEDPTLMTATETTETPDPKGKARSIFGPVSSEGETSESAVRGPTEENDAAEDTLTPLTPRKPPRIRNRSFFESVQAHLVLPPRKERVTRTLHDSAASPSRVYSTLERQDSAPSLLARLSDPVVDRLKLQDDVGSGFVASLAECTPRTYTPSVAPSQQFEPDATFERESSNTLASSSRTKLSMSAPEIMARTRVRLAKSAAITSDDRATSMTLDGVATAQPQPLSPSALSLGSQQDGNVDISTSPAHIRESRASNLRTKLLSRLEEERQQARSVETKRGGRLLALDATSAKHQDVALDRISQAAQPIAFPIDVTSSGVPRPSDSAAIEARLRRQAQLRVRLAAEKRSHASQGV
ncbi:hypothetical protein B0H10DRAFT_2427009 [Mycena sp. CBHHK59/15]|nr:hypothetical protein B0H10DRAFT_2427009 [Mycena sp. CBHHK59/15]